MNKIVNLINIERALLSGIFFTPEKFDEVLDTGIKKEWFYAIEHKQIFEALTILKLRKKPIDIDFALKQLKNIVDEKTLLEIVSANPIVNFVQYIEEIREEFKLRQINTIALNIKRNLDEDGVDSLAIISLAMDQLKDLESVGSTKKTKTISQIRKERKAKPPIERISTGIPFIDTILRKKKDAKGGFKSEGLIYLSGIKQTGKTFVATKIVENISKTDPVAFASLEFGVDLYDENIEEAEDEGYWNGNIDNIYSFDDIFDVTQIASEIRYLHKFKGIKIAVIDSMLRMTNNKPELATDTKRLDDLFSIMGKLTVELKIPILIIVQSSKEDLKSSIISVKGSTNADHENFVWFHFSKNSKDPEDEIRVVTTNKNKDTHKHPKFLLEFNPYTHDFYRIKYDDNKQKVYIDKPRYKEPVIIEYETSNGDTTDTQMEMPIPN